MALERITDFAHLLPGWTPSQRKSLKAREEAEDKAQCAGCRALTKKGLWPGHPDLADPKVQAVFTDAFNQELEGSPELPTCPYPDMEGICPQLKRLKAKPSVSSVKKNSQTGKGSRI